MLEYRHESLKYPSFLVSLIIHLAIFLLFFLYYSTEKIRFESQAPLQEELREDEDTSHPSQAAFKPRAFHNNLPLSFEEFPALPQPELADQKIVSEEQQVPPPKEESIERNKEEKIEKDDFKEPLEKLNNIEPQQQMNSGQTQLPLPFHVAKQLANTQPIKKTATVKGNKPTFGQLMNDFITSLNHEGTDLIKRNGTNQQRTLADMKYMSYMHKFFEYLESSSRQHPLLLQESIKESIVLPLEIILAKDGTVIDVILAQTSGLFALDNYIIKTIKRGSPFPPIPDHISKNEWLMKLNIFIDKVKHVQNAPIYLERCLK